MKQSEYNRGSLGSDLFEGGGGYFSLDKFCSVQNFNFL